MSSTPSGKRQSVVEPSSSSKSAQSPSPAAHRKSMASPNDGNASNSSKNVKGSEKSKSKSKDERDDARGLPVLDAEGDDDDEDDEEKKKKDKKNRKNRGGGELEQFLYDLEKDEDEKKHEKIWQDREQAKEEAFQEKLAECRASRHSLAKKFLKEQGIQFKIKADYDYKKSTEDNYSVKPPAKSKKSPFVGRYTGHREKLDHSVHSYYSPERQALQDLIIDKFVTTAKEIIAHEEAPLENWIVFTAGTMGAGKIHTMKWLGKEGLFPLETFVHVNPDEVRRYLPETCEYNELDDNKTSTYTQKEVSYLCEIITMDALDKHHNVLADCSLRNHSGYVQYFQDLRRLYPILKIAIVHVDANVFTILDRAKQRAVVTGRVLTEKTILNSVKDVTSTMNILTPHCDFFARIINEDGVDPVLANCELHIRDEHLDTGDDDTGSEANGEEGSGIRKKIGGKKVKEDANLKNEWTLLKKETGGDFPPPISSPVVNSPAIGSTAPLLVASPGMMIVDGVEVPIPTHILTNLKRKKGFSYLKGEGAAPSIASASTDDQEGSGKQVSFAAKILDHKNRDGNDKKKKNKVKAAIANANASDLEQGIVERITTEICDWRPHFQQVWQMRCVAELYYQDRLRRLTAVKDGNAPPIVHTTSVIAEGDNSGAGDSSSGKGGKDKMKATNTAPVVDGKQATGGGWLCFPFLKAAPSPSPYAKIDPEYAGSTDETVKLET